MADRGAVTTTCPVSLTLGGLGPHLEVKVKEAYLYSAYYERLVSGAQ